MKSIMLGVGAVLTLCACVSSGPQTAWGKEGVTMLDYRTDGGQCAIVAVTLPAEGNAANSAGGIGGQNGNTRIPPAPGGGPPTPGSPANPPPTGSAFPTGAGGAYRDNTSQDTVMRAANQQQAQEVEANRARSARLKSCLVERGYTEFSLTPEQRAHLATLPEGSNERREFLYKLGTDPNVLKTQAIVRKGS